MSITPRLTSPEGESTPQAFLAALRAGGTRALAEAFGDLAFLLQEVAGEPGEAFSLAGRERQDFSDLLGNLQACAGTMAALEARSVVALRDVTRRDRYAAARERAAHERTAEPSRTASDGRADSVTTEDLSLITRRSPHMAGRTLASAQRLVETLPRTMDALRTGKVGSDAAYAVADAASILEPDLARAVDRALDERRAEFDGAGTRRWKDAVATIAGELDPEGENLRHRRARKRRHVTMRPGKHGMATLSARVPAIDARQIHKRLSLEAESRRADGDRNGHGAAMADAFTDTLLDRADGKRAPVTLEVGVIITDRALFRPDVGDTAHLEGYGPVPAEAVREQLRAVTEEPQGPDKDPFGTEGPSVRATIRRLYTHPTVGELVAMDATARTFPPAMRRFLTWRDTSCRGPYCNAAARQSDHVVPVSRGGPTSLDNGESLCAHCNQKESSTAGVERVEGPDAPGHQVRWTGHSGTSRVTTPTPLVWPRTPEAESDAAVDGLTGPGPDDESGVTRPRRQRASAPRPSQRPSPRPPARSGPAASGARGSGPARRVPPSGRRKDRDDPADDPDR